MTGRYYLIKTGDFSGENVPQGCFDKWKKNQLFPVFVLVELIDIAADTTDNRIKISGKNTNFSWAVLGPGRHLYAHCYILQTLNNFLAVEVSYKYTTFNFIDRI